MISIIIPANNEEQYIGSCLNHLLQSKISGDEYPQVIVVANGCTDDTVSEAATLIPKFSEKGWRLDVLDLKEGSKINALNAGDEAALFEQRAYIDADIQVTCDLIAQLVNVLDTPEPAYASGQLAVPPARSFISERYARFWLKLPFITRGVPGCGVFAVNAAGRARWGTFPNVISDDTFVRYNFSPEEMHGVPATYSWPITEGFASLVRVRRRQDQGLNEICQRWPDLAAQMACTTPNNTEKLRLFFRDPLGFIIYSAVALAVRLPVFRNQSRWDRGR